MANFNDLPIELVHRILDLTIEDAVAIDDTLLRSEILTQLSSVSKSFNPHISTLWWRNIPLSYKSDDLYHCADVIIEGAGQIIEDFIFLFNDFSDAFTTNLEWDFLVKVLDKVATVKKLTLIVTNNNKRSFNLCDFFEIPSLKNLKYFEINHGFEFVYSKEFALPSLQGLQLPSLTPKNDHFYSQLIQSSNTTLTSLQLNSFTFKHYSESSTLESIHLVAFNLTALTIDNCDDQIALLLLPFCTSLKSLKLTSSATSFESLITQLNSLPSLTRLDSLTLFVEDLLISLELGEEDNIPLVDNQDFTSFISALDSIVFSQLKYLYLTSVLDSEDPLAKPFEEIARGRIDFMERIERRGIILEFEEKEEIEIKKEKEKQRIYQERQDKLDLELK